MRFLFVIAVLVSVPGIDPVSAQGIVKGTVSDKQTGEPLAGVYVIYGQASGTSTDSEGRYSFQADSSWIRVSFQLIGSITETRNFSIPRGETVIADIKLETETMLLDQVVVSADRIEHRISDVTVSVDVIKADFLNRNHITEAQELITKTTGIEVIDGQASVRGGSGFSYGVGSRVLALVDGLPLLSPDAGGVRWQYLPVENLAQVEIIKGASSVLYGSSALNGIISFRSADASNIPSTRIFAETGLYLRPRNEEWKWWNAPRPFSTVSFSHLRKAGNTDIGIGLNLFIDESYRKFNDEKLGKMNLRIKHFSSRVEGLNYGLNISAGVTRKTDFILWESAEKALVQASGTVSLLDGRFLAIDPFIQLGRKNRFRHDFRMRIQATENRFPVKVQNNAAAVSVYSEYQLWYNINSMLNITAGLSETWNSINSNFHGDHRGLNIGIFTQLELRPAERLKLVGGVRAEQNILDSDADRIVPVFRTGLNYQAAQYTYLRASFGQGYRFPSIAEKYASTTLGSVSIFPNPFVESESGWSSEAGIMQGIAFGKFTGQADLALFFSQNKNMIEYIFLGASPEGAGFIAFNVEKSRIYGAETEIVVNRKTENSSFMIAAGYTYIYPLDLTAASSPGPTTYLKFRRKHSGKITLTHEWKKTDFSLSFYARSKTLNIDDVFLNPSTREDILPGFYDYWLENNRGYLIADAVAGYRFSDRLRLSAAVKNVANAEYMGRPGDIQPPRSISLRIEYKF